MNCSKVRELLSDSLNGVLPPEKQATVEMHLLSCPACRTEAEEIRKTVRIVSEFAPARLPRDFDQRLFARVDALTALREAGPMKRPRGLSLKPVPWFSTAGKLWLAGASAALTAAGSLAVWQLAPGNGPGSSHPYVAACVQAHQMTPAPVVDHSTLDVSPDADLVSESAD